MAHGYSMLLHGPLRSIHVRGERKRRSSTHDVERGQKKNARPPPFSLPNSRRGLLANSGAHYNARAGILEYPLLVERPRLQPTVCNAVVGALGGRRAGGRGAWQECRDFQPAAKNAARASRAAQLCPRQDWQRQRSSGIRRQVRQASASLSCAPRATPHRSTHPTSRDPCTYGSGREHPGRIMTPHRRIGAAHGASTSTPGPRRKRPVGPGGRTIPKHGDAALKLKLEGLVRVLRLNPARCAGCLL